MKNILFKSAIKLDFALYGFPAHMTQFQGLYAFRTRGVATVEHNRDVVLHAYGALVLLLQVVQLVDQHLLILGHLAGCVAAGGHFFRPDTGLQLGLDDRLALEALLHPGTTLGANDAVAAGHELDGWRHL